VTMRIPSVIALRTFVKPNGRVVLTNRNIFLRDRYRCQYCGERHALTVDHVQPRSKGGLHAWENVASACHACNGRKGDSVGVMHPMKVPREPTPAELLALQREQFRQRMHDTWLPYLPAEAA
jgi:5-methylcytosine-specific restriction endonuclease McrA